jgi:hypothetical protein
MFTAHGKESTKETAALRQPINSWIFFCPPFFLIKSSREFVKNILIGKLYSPAGCSYSRSGRARDVFFFLPHTRTTSPTCPTSSIPAVSRRLDSSSSVAADRALSTPFRTPCSGTLIPMAAATVPVSLALLVLKPNGQNKHGCARPNTIRSVKLQTCCPFGVHRRSLR